MSDDQYLYEKADKSRQEKCNWQRDKKEHVDRIIWSVAEQQLDFVGRVGADHHQFAVGHVDHAHLAKDDRQSECHQDQDASQREAVEKILGPCDFPLVPLDRLQGHREGLLLGRLE